MRGLGFALILVTALPALAQDGSGAALYLRGEGAEALLMGGKLRAPATRFACAGCHGADARGSREGATVFPAIDWPGLSAPDRPGGAYDRASFLRAMTEGLAPDGRTLDPAMPRFAAEDAAFDTLIGFLQGVGASQQRGITPDALRLGAPPDTPALTGLQAAAQDFNESGGAFGRRIEVVTDGETAMDAEGLAALLGAPAAPGDLSAPLSAARKPRRLSAGADAGRGAGFLRAPAEPRLSGNHPAQARPGPDPAPEPGAPELATQPGCPSPHA